MQQLIEAQGADSTPPTQQPYGDVVALNTCRQVLDAVGPAELADIADEYVALLGSSAAVYEVNGDYAHGIFSSGWCRLLDRSSRALCATDDNRKALSCGRWHCHESCWQTSRKAIETGEPADCECLGGIRIYAVPIRAAGRVVGAINFGYGDPPSDPESLALLGQRYHVPVEELRRQAEAYASRAASIIESAKQRLHASARLIGALVERKQAKEDLERTAAALARSNEELQQFAYVVSHDLQEPLRMVTSYMELLTRRYRGRLDADADDFIAFAVDGATRMQQLINDLLNYSRVGTRANEFVPTACDTMIENVLANLQVMIESTQAVITHDPLPTVMADEVQLAQVLQNLIGNALKFHGAAPPQVHVSAARDNGAWRFAVRDNGIGIDPQHFEHIFVVFQRLHRRDAYPGTGIGLAICKRIVERHGGRIWVESAPGTGSTFFFTIPDRAGEAGNGRLQGAV